MHVVASGLHDDCRLYIRRLYRWRR